MSHEIRTPLNGVLGLTELALRTATSAEQRRFLETAHDSGQTLLRLINDVLDLSRIEAGHVELQAAPFRSGGTARRCHAQPDFDDAAARGPVDGLRLAW